MKKRKWVWITLALVLVLVLCAIMLNNPRIKSNLFVRLHHEQIEEGLKMNAGVPADDAVLFGYESVNTWPGEHSMVEFLISGFGLGSATSYYGCYYSSDDVPLAFQNMDVKLTQCGHESWKWSQRGDNHGKTMKIMDHWYYFEASF